MKLLASNQFWGRRSGQKMKDGGMGFLQFQFGSGASGAGRAFHTPLINVPRKWFGRVYKGKNDFKVQPVVKGKK
jgi:hypothetical protein